MAGDWVDMLSHPSYTGGTHSTGSRRETTMQCCTLRLLVTLALATVAPFVAVAQPVGKVPRIGVLCPTRCGGAPLAGFLHGLHEWGYVEDQNIRLEYRQAEGRFERLPALATELVRLNVDVIVTASAGAAAAKNATQTIPIVFGGVATPIEAGLVASLDQRICGESARTAQGGRARGCAGRCAL